MEKEERILLKFSPMAKTLYKRLKRVLIMQGYEVELVKFINRYPRVKIRKQNEQWKACCWATVEDMKLTLEYLKK